jgi:extracellular factor (EF) 3-hydroxypalmitic acid methyl ester biosynthesis protein
MEKSVLNDAIVTGRTAQGGDIRATVMHVTRFMAVFELYNAGVVLHVSEVLAEFKIVVQNRVVYSGRAIVKNIVDTGLLLICEVNLEDSWLDVDLWVSDRSGTKLQEEFKRFFEGWQNVYRVSPEYKALAADMHTFLSDLRLWLEQVELGIRALPDGDRGEVERRLAEQISQSVFPCLDGLFEQFEGVASRIQEDALPGHEAYIKRLIHPLVLSSPFAFRSVQKPLGYAGDYEMVNMILGDPHQGGSLFGKVLNRWFIKQPPAEAHRNRIKYLAQKLVEETARVSAQNRVARVYSIGCGPAGEVLSFLGQQNVSDRAEFTLLDFNDETLTYARNSLETAKRQHHRVTPIQFVKKSVFQILKGKGKSVEGPLETKYDLIYCAGLFDYLNDQVCQQLTGLLYDMLAPGGLLITTNVDVSNPIRHWLGSILEWHLIYRSSRQFQTLGAHLPNQDSIRIWSDETGVNLFFEIRRAAS